MGAVDVLNVRACEGRSESSGGGECGKEPLPFAHRNRALADVNVSARPDDQTADDGGGLRLPGQRLTASPTARRRGDCDSCGLWPVLSDTRTT